MSKKEKLLLSMLVVGITAGLAAFGVFSAFSSQTSNPGNNFTAGTSFRFHPSIETPLEESRSNHGTGFSLRPK